MGWRKSRNGETKKDYDVNDKNLCKFFRVSVFGCVEELLKQFLVQESATFSENFIRIVFPMTKTLMVRSKSEINNLSSALVSL